ncbi:hypothetical protein [Thermoflexibacter ruber]|uniref:Uncharacterized protein n=1 Tax=Thermoflexibacter ruber TaxID=1003 RepID=A0A1I2BJD3_9BACT|nr:hypothetical protein [Thermoflexibacter ruber]SFE56304.1 hypothetical protein SAMN04488541_100341 [Thermoflexibacter ruber]
MMLSNQVVTLQQAEKLLEDRLSSSLRTLTLGDVSTLTGLSTDDAKQTLEKLMSKYDCTLKVTEAGDLIYDFGSTLLRRGKKTIAEYWSEIKDFLWKAFQVFFKLWIAVTLVFYFVVFLVVLIAIILAAVFGDSDSDFDVGDAVGGLFHALIEMFRMIFIWDALTGSTTYYETDSRGYKYKHYAPKSSTWSKLSKKNRELPSKSFVVSVYDFVFGPSRVENTLADNLKELATYARKQNGIIVPAEIKGLTGYPSEEADKFMTDSMVHFNGKAEVSEQGVLYADFEDLIRSAANKQVESKVEWFWDEYEPEYEITGNTAGRNAGIIAMNLFNLVLSGVVLGMANDYSELPKWIEVVFGWIPLTFSTIFFSVPILRTIFILPKRKKRHLNNIRKRLMKVIFHDSDKELPLSALEQAVNAKSAGEEKLSQKQIEQVMNDLIIDLQGEIDVKDNGEIVYRFDKLKTELQEAERLRKAKGFIPMSQKIVFDSGI